MHQSEQKMIALSISRMEAESKGLEYNNSILQPDNTIVQDLQNHMRTTMKASNIHKKGYIIWLKDYNLKALFNSVKIHELQNTEAIAIRVKSAARRLDPENDTRINKLLTQNCQFVHAQLSIAERTYIDVIKDDPLIFRSLALEKIISNPWHPFPFVEIKTENDVSQI